MFVAGDFVTHAPELVGAVVVLLFPLIVVRLLEVEQCLILVVETCLDLVPVRLELFGRHRLHAQPHVGGVLCCVAGSRLEHFVQS